MNTTDNKWSTDIRATNSSPYGTFSYLGCDTRYIVLHWQNTLKIDHYLVVLYFATVHGPDTYIFPFQKFLRILKVWVLAEIPIMKYIEISDWTLIPC